MPVAPYQERVAPSEEDRLLSLQSSQFRLVRLEKRGVVQCSPRRERERKPGQVTGQPSRQVPAPRSARELFYRGAAHAAPRPTPLSTSTCLGGTVSRPMRAASP